MLSFLLILAAPSQASGRKLVGYDNRGLSLFLSSMYGRHRLYFRKRRIKSSIPKFSEWHPNLSSC